MKTSLILRSIRPADYELSGTILILKTERNCMLLIEALNLFGYKTNLNFQIDNYNNTNEDLIILKNKFNLNTIVEIVEYINLNQ